MISQKTKYLYHVCILDVLILFVCIGRTADLVNTEINAVDTNGIGPYKVCHESAQAVNATYRPITL